MSGSALHLALTDLTAIFVSAAVADLEVVDGPNEDPHAAMLLEVGWAGVDGSGASVVRARLDRAAARSRESIDVRCLLSCHDDRLSVAETRALLVDTFDQLEAVLRSPAQARVGGASSLLLAEVTEYDYFPAMNSGGVGATAAIPFTVNVTAVK